MKTGCKPKRGKQPVFTFQGNECSQRCRLPNVDFLLSSRKQTIGRHGDSENFGDNPLEKGIISAYHRFLYRKLLTYDLSVCR